MLASLSGPMFTKAPSLWPPDDSLNSWTFTGGVHSSPNWYGYSDPYLFPNVQIGSNAAVRDDGLTLIATRAPTSGNGVSGIYIALRGPYDVLNGTKYYGAERTFMLLGGSNQGFAFTGSLVSINTSDMVTGIITWEGAAGSQFIIQDGVPYQMRMYR